MNLGNVDTVKKHLTDKLLTSMNGNRLRNLLQAFRAHRAASTVHCWCGCGGVEYFDKERHNFYDFQIRRVKRVMKEKGLLK